MARIRRKPWFSISTATQRTTGLEFGPRSSSRAARCVAAGAITRKASGSARKSGGPARPASDATPVFKIAKRRRSPHPRPGSRWIVPDAMVARLALTPALPGRCAPLALAGPWMNCSLKSSWIALGTKPLAAGSPSQVGNRAPNRVLQLNSSKAARNGICIPPLTPAARWLRRFSIGFSIMQIWFCSILSTWIQPSIGS